jgi:hypothetical protein
MFIRCNIQIIEYITSKGKMKRQFRFTMDLEVDSKEQVNSRQPNSDMIKAYLEAFVNDGQAMLERARLFLLCQLQADAFIEDIQQSFGISEPLDDDSVFTSVLEKCPPGVRDHFQRLFDSGNVWESADFEVFLENLGGLTFKGACLEEVKTAVRR